MLECSEERALRDGLALMNALEVPENLKLNVVASLHKMFGSGESYVHESHVAAVIAALLFVLQVERPWEDHQDTPDGQAYMHLRAEAQLKAAELMAPVGDENLDRFQGEPELYGIVNACVNKLFDAYGGKLPEGGA